MRLSDSRGMGRVSTPGDDFDSRSNVQNDSENGRRRNRNDERAEEELAAGDAEVGG